jgi:hypothetical protein
MTDDLRYKRLQRAKLLAMSGDYEGAYSILNSLHKKYPRDIETHRLHGNVLEMDAFASEVAKPTDVRLKSARKHYAQVFRINKHDQFVLFDLAEHFSNIGKKGLAAHFFKSFLAEHEFESSLSDEIETARSWLEENKGPVERGQVHF